MNLLATRRAVTLGFSLAFSVVCYWAERVRGPLTLERRALWLQATCKRVLRAFGIQYTVEGKAPTRGVVVANHLSYLDIVILSAAMPCFFVAKMEIRRWPFFGKAARVGGTLFIDRSSLASAEKVASLISARLDIEVPVLFFPEGTSTDGTTVHRFHSRLFEPAVRAGALVTAAAIRYKLDNGAEERDLCWFGDDAFLPHLWRTLGTDGFTAEVIFGESSVYPHRRIAAESTRTEIQEMRKGALVLQ